MQSAARIIGSLMANQFHTCSLRSIFGQVHALAQMDADGTLSRLSVKYSGMDISEEQ